MPRFAILEHTGAPDDPAGIHYDLLIESGAVCRTWRLAAIPQAGGPPVPAVELPPHRLAWLDHVAGAVSGGRGFARRVDWGFYEPVAAAAFGTDPGVMVDVQLQGDRIAGRFMLRLHDAGWLASLAANSPGAAAQER